MNDTHQYIQREFHYKFSCQLLQYTPLYNMKSDSNWFESPQPKSNNFYLFPSQKPDHDPQPDEPQDLKHESYSPDPLSFLRCNITPKELSPWSKILNAQSDHKEEHLSLPGILPSDYKKEAIDQRLVFSEDQDEDQLTPIKHEQDNKQNHQDAELLTTGKKSLFQPILAARKPRPREKGLRKLSQRAYEIVQELKNATYKEVAAKLVSELNQEDFESESKQEQNIKRRVYDALNVLIALGVLRKDGRKIISDKLKKNTETPLNYVKDVEFLTQKLKLKTALIEEKKKKKKQTELKYLTIKTILHRNRDQNYSTNVTVPFPFISIIILNSQFEDIKTLTQEHFQIICKTTLQPHGDIDSMKWLKESLPIAAQTKKDKQEL